MSSTRLKNIIPQLIAAFIAVSIIVSCHAVDRAALSCPEISNPRYRTANHRLNINKLSLKQKINPNVRHPSYVARPGINPEQLFGIKKDNFQSQLEASTVRTFIPQQVICDTIFLRSGSWMNVKVIRTGLQKIRYSSCLPTTGSTSYISIKDVRSIKYANGDTKYFGGGNDNIQSVNKASKINEPFGVFGLISSLMILLFRYSSTSVLFLLTGFVLGCISFFRIRRHPDKFKGKALAVFSIVIVLTLAAIAILAFLIVWGVNASNTNL